MANTNITKGTDTSVSRPRDLFDAMRREMDDVLGRFEQGWPRWPSLFGRSRGDEMMVPDLDIHESSKQITVEVDLPGLEEKDVSVTLANGVLTIKGERKHEREEQKENYYLAERSFGSFERALRLPDTIDESRVEARFDKGVLKVIAQKKPEAVKAEKRIEIRKG